MDPIIDKKLTLIKEDLICTMAKFDEKVKKGVDEAIAPLAARQEAHEAKSDERMTTMETKIQELVNQHSTRPPWPALESRPPPTATQPPTPPPPQVSSPATVSTTDILIKRRFEEGRLTLGFEPIDYKDIDRVGRMNGVNDLEHKMKLAVAEFIRGDLAIKTVDTENIVKVFMQPSKTEKDCIRLYAQFDTLATVGTIWQHVIKLRGKPDHQVMMYVPSTHQDQFQYLNSVAYKYRNPAEGMEKSSTRIKYGHENLFLQHKPKWSATWNTVKTPDLPPPSLRSGPTLSPPTGRQRDCLPPPKRVATSPPEHRTHKQSRTDLIKPAEDGLDIAADDNNEVFEDARSKEPVSANPSLNSSVPT